MIFTTMELPVYLMTIDEVDEGVSYVALVESPAIERPFHAFSKDRMKFSETGEKRVLTGPLMLADTPILRRDKTRGEYYVIFQKETIRKMVQKYFKQGNQHNVNAEHRQELDGVYMFESYLIDRDRGINPPTGFEDVADGSWFGSFKVENDEVWDNRDSFTGFSIEGYFGMQPTESEIEVAMSEFAQAFESFLHTIKTNDI
jgi:hypothetical protein